jgi:hypothetical protein
MLTCIGNGIKLPHIAVNNCTLWLARLTAKTEAAVAQHVPRLRLGCRQEGNHHLLQYCEEGQSCYCQTTAALAEKCQTCE